jgi:MerR family transcriptional regulator, copper efflux regulator
VGIDEWFTIDRAARHLGVSTRTLRRWIKAGKLDAQLQPGPYGQQYVVPRSSMAGVQVVRDVERAERQAEREAIPRVLETYLAEREGALSKELATVRAELADAVGRLEQQQTEILRRLEQMQRDLGASRAAAGDASADPPNRR